jgi:hypothetical protein
MDGSTRTRRDKTNPDDLLEVESLHLLVVDGRAGPFLVDHGEADAGLIKAGGVAVGWE